jgi:hypothetical protein
MTRLKLAQLIATEIARQGNDVDNLGDDESICLLNALPTINLVELVECILSTISKEELDLALAAHIEAALKDALKEDD